MNTKILKTLMYIGVLALALQTLPVHADEDSATSSEGNKGRLEARFEKNSDVRNLKIEDKKIKEAAKLQREEVKDMRKDIKDDRKEDMKDLRASSTMAMKDLRASTTLKFKEIKGEKREIAKKMKRDAFQIRKDALVKQLNLSIKNLSDIRTRINERIATAEASGRTMTEAKAALVIADEKLAKAKIAVDAFAALSISTGTTTGTSTPEVDLEKPRKVGDEAIKAVKEAREAFVKVVKAIAQAMGLKEGKTPSPSTTTTVTPSPTTSASPSTTASPTPTN